MKEKHKKHEVYDYVCREEPERHAPAKCLRQQSTEDRAKR